MQNKSFALIELAEKFQLRLKGNNTNIQGVASLSDATSIHLCCIRDEKYLKSAIDSNAGAFIVGEEIDIDIDKPILISKDPYFSFIEIEKLFLLPMQIHNDNNSVFIHHSAILSKTAIIGPFSYLGANVKIADNVLIHSGVKILDNVKIGKNSVIFPGVTIFDNCKIGSNCVIGANSVIGGEGFGFHFANGIHNKVPQTGFVVIEDNVEIGSLVSIDRATFGFTLVGEGSKIDNQVQIAHNVKLGNHVIVVAQTGISGSTEIGDYSVLAGKAGIVGHIKIGKGVTVGGASVVTKSVEDGKFVIGYPAVESKLWKKQAIYIAKLPELNKKIKKIEKKITKIFKNMEGLDE